MFSYIVTVYNEDASTKQKFGHKRSASKDSSKEIRVNSDVVDKILENKSKYEYEITRVKFILVIVFFILVKNKNIYNLKDDQRTVSALVKLDRTFKKLIKALEQSQLIGM